MSRRKERRMKRNSNQGGGDGEGDYVREEGGGGRFCM